MSLLVIQAKLRVYDSYHQPNECFIKFHRTPAGEERAWCMRRATMFLRMEGGSGGQYTEGEARS